MCAYSRPMSSAENSDSFEFFNEISTLILALSLIWQDEKVKYQKRGLYFCDKKPEISRLQAPLLGRSSV